MKKTAIRCISRGYRMRLGIGVDVAVDVLFSCSIPATLTHIHTQIVFPAYTRSNYTVFVGYYRMY
jgi:hypothetical protein